MNHSRCTNEHKTVVFQRHYKYLVKIISWLVSVNLLLIQSSCATSHPKETYLTKADLTSISKVAVIASSNTPEVFYTESTSPGVQIFTFVLLGPIAALGIHEATMSIADTEHSQEVGKRVDLSIIEDKIANVFITSLGNSSCLKNADYLKEQDERQMSAEGYDAVLSLTVSKITLYRVYSDNVKLQVHVHGLLKSIRSGKTLWDREEIATSRNSNTLAYYKENSMKELDAVLEKAGRNLGFCIPKIRGGRKMDRKRIHFVILSVMALLTAFIAGCTHIVKTNDFSGFQAGSPLSSIKPKIFAFNEFKDSRVSGDDDPSVFTKNAGHIFKLDQSPASMAASALQKELKRNGHECISFSTNVKSDFIVDGTIFKFTVMSRPRLFHVEHSSKIAMKLSVSRVPVSNGLFVKSYQGEYESKEGSGIEYLGNNIQQSLLTMIKEISTDQEGSVR